MLGEFVRMLVAPNTRIGTIQAVQFRKDHLHFLFHQDPRITIRLPDIWLRDSEFEECKRPTEEEITRINNLNIPNE